MISFLRKSRLNLFYYACIVIVELGMMQDLQGAVQYPISVTSQTGIGGSGNVTGIPNGGTAKWYQVNDVIVVDFGLILPAGTQYTFHWNERSGVSGTAQPLIEESADNSTFTALVAVVSTNSTTIVIDTITSENDFRYLRITLDNSISATDFEIDAIGLLGDDTDNDGVVDFLDIDDDNDGIQDLIETNCNNPVITFKTSPEAYWTMENNTNDVSGNGHNERVDGNAPAFSSISIEGNFSANFNGTTNRIRYSQDGGFMELDYTEVSFSAWILPSSLTGTRIIYEEGGSTNGLIMWLNNGVLTFSARNGGAASQTEVTIPTALTLDGVWHHVACTFNNGVMTIYLDGTSNSVTALYTNIPAHSSDGGIGGDFSDNPIELAGKYHGLMDAVRYSNNTVWGAGTIATEAQKACDNDGDGVDNRVDLDADNDGIQDIIEAGGTDADGNGIVDGAFTDTDGDGWSNTFDADDGGTALSIPNTDTDQFPDFIDIDSDADGIVDVIEAQASTTTPIVPLGVDADTDGIDNAFDQDLGASFLTPVNTDLTDLPDYRDIDSDNDIDVDFTEAYDLDNDGVADIGLAGADSDGDGLDNTVDNLVGPNASTNVTNNGQNSSSFPNLDLGTAERDWREIVDADNDGVTDRLDYDNDNDGILDLDEVSCQLLLSLEAYWPLDNNSDDVSGNDHDERNDGNTPPFSTTAIQGSHSANFNGTSNRIRYSQNGGFMEIPYTEISFSAWIRPTSVTGERIIYEEGGATNGMLLWIENGELKLAVRSGGAGSQTTATAPIPISVDGAWHHVAGTFNNGVITVFLDGASSSETAGFTIMPSRGSDGGLGGNISDNAAGIADGSFAGLIDAVKYDNASAWSATRIRNEFRKECDTDGDSQPDYLDLDTDNDGIQDIVEAGGVDANGDGIVDGVFTDTDQDGLANTFDADDGGTPLTNPDTDGDGIANYADIDSDADGIVDVIEAQASTATPIVPLGADTDGDGIDNAFDIDLGNSFLLVVNTDLADNPDYIDPDSDNDGDSDQLEAYDTDNDSIANTLPSGSDTDGDGLDNNFDNIVGPNASTNISNNGQTSNSFPNLDNTANAERDWRDILDVDRDGVTDRLDVDNDNDGILDLDEVVCSNLQDPAEAYWPLDNNTDDASGNNHDERPDGGTPGFSTIAVQGTHSGDFNGTSHRVRYSQDGTFMESAYTEISFSAWIRPSDLSGNRIIYEEGGRTNGIILWFNNGILTLTARDGGAGSETSVAMPNQLSIDGLWHHVACVFDNGTMTVYLDGASNTIVASFVVISAHGSDGGIGGDFSQNAADITGFYAGLMDAVRYDNTTAWSTTRIVDEVRKNCDTDGDGINNYLDLDSDNDGVQDIIEAGGVDANGDGIVDGVFADTDGDGWANTFDADDGGTALPNADLDGDGIQNYLDIDADNDGLIDNVEAQTTATFRTPLNSDTDRDGWDDRYDSDNGGTAMTLSNNEGTGAFDFLDEDSDDDGLYDWIEGFDDDESTDALNDFIARANAFEIAAGNPLFYINTDDADTDGIPDWLEDTDGDNRANFLDPDNAFYHDTDNDGLIDLFDSDNNGVASFLPDGDGDGNPDFRDGDDQISLPIVLLDFTAVKIGKSVQLKWATLTEINNDYFVIERSLDGKVFEPILRKKGAGNSTTQLSYVSYDEQPHVGYNYYRLRQVDFDGKTETFEVKAVHFNELNKTKMKAYPNPTSGNQLYLSIEQAQAGRCSIEILSQSGKQLKVHEEFITSGLNNINVEVLGGQQLAKGIYNLRVISGDSVQTIPFIVQ